MLAEFSLVHLFRGLCSGSAQNDAPAGFMHAVGKPFVKPTTTGRGMNLTAVPNPVAPRNSRKTPASKVHMKRPSTPYFATIPNTTTTNAPVGPPICVEDPPKAETVKPATIAQ